MFTNSMAQMAQSMVRTQLQRRGVTDKRVLEAMVNVPRHLFFEEPSVGLTSSLFQQDSLLQTDTNLGNHIQPHADTYADAYADQANPIGQGQTISQPFIVAMMTQWLNIQPGCRVLEVGTGSGYQTAVMMELGAQVWTIERSEILSTRTDKLMRLLLPSEKIRQEHLHMCVGDGTLGWPQGSPFDRIIVTAAAPHLPSAYEKQLAPNGRIVIPIGDRDQQHLMLFDKRDDTLMSQKTLACRFVPLIGADGWEALPDTANSSLSTQHKLSQGPSGKVTD